MIELALEKVKALVLFTQEIVKSKRIAYDNMVGIEDMVLLKLDGENFL